MKRTFDVVGRIQISKLTDTKVTPYLPGYTSQVKLSYRTQFERTTETELFTWNIKNGRARLFEYTLVPASITK